MPFRIATINKEKKTTKYLGINLVKEKKDLFNENFKML